MDLREKCLRNTLKEKNLLYILEFLTNHCNRSVSQIFDSSRRNILYQQLDYINNHEDNDDNVHFELFDMQDFVFIIDQIDKKFNPPNDNNNFNPQQIICSPKSPQHQHSIQYDEYKCKLQTKKNDLKELIEIRTKWMKLLIDERKHILYQQIENEYNNKLNQLYQYDKQMIQITNDVEIQYNKFKEYNKNTQTENKNEQKSEINNEFNFEQRNNILLKIQNKLLNNKLKLENIESIIDDNIMTFSDIIWDKQQFENIISDYMQIDYENIKNDKLNNNNINEFEQKQEPKVIKPLKYRSNTCYNIGVKSVSNDLLINKQETICNDITWSNKYKGKDIIINVDKNECILSNNAINQSIILNQTIPKNKIMKYEMQLNKNGGSGCYFIGVISDINKCDFNGIAMYGSVLINAFGIDDTNKWVYKGENGIDIVEWKPEIKSNDILSIITEYKLNNELNLRFILNNKIAIKPNDSSTEYSMTIPQQKLSSDYQWYIAISLVETGSSCILRSCSILK
eukprot:474632_1